MAVSELGQPQRKRNGELPVARIYAGVDLKGQRQARLPRLPGSLVACTAFSVHEGIVDLPQYALLNDLSGIHPLDLLRGPRRKWCLTPRRRG